MVRIASPDPAAPALDIKLSQNPNFFFFPASMISGHVVYKNHCGNADYDLRLIFAGVNKVCTKNTADPVIEKATLFEYPLNLHTARKGRNHRLANRQVDTAPMEYAFKYRFPSTTDNRSFTLVGNTALNTTFSNHVHDLPPTFGTHSSNFKCSVEYQLRAELYYDNCLLTQSTLPVVFLPYTRPVHGTRGNPSFFANPNPFADRALGKIRKDSLVSHYPETVLNMGVELPSEISMGTPFRFEVQIEVPFSPDFDDELPQVKVLTLKMSCLAQCRFVEGAAANDAGVDEKQYHKAKDILLHPAHTSEPPIFNPASRMLRYTFEATLSSYYPPSFRSFLVSNTFRFEGPVQVAVDGRKLELPLSEGQVAVLSPVAQPTGARRISTMTAGSRMGSACYGRVC